MTDADKPVFVPQPLSVERTQTLCPLSVHGFDVTWAGKRDRPAARAVARAWRQIRERASGLQRSTATPITIDLGSAQSGSSADESYRLTIDAGGVRVAAPEPAGALRALVTLVQCVRGNALAGVEIVDAPRLRWRGVMLDVARHYIEPHVLYKTLEAMAFCKLNVLQLHLTDDQAFRFRSRAHPALAAADSYSWDVLRALVAFAADRGIRVIPEIDMPGHTTSWVRAYPEWGVRPVDASARFGVHDTCLDVSSDVVIDAVDQLLEELGTVFPDPVVHIGGDEVKADAWRESSRVQAYMADRGLGDAAALQADFVCRVVQRVEARGKTAMVWDDAIHPTLPQSVLVQAWRGAHAKARALHAGHDCVMSAGQYLDLFYPPDVHAAFDPLAPVDVLESAEDALLTDPRFAHAAAGMAWTKHWRNEALTPPRQGGEVVGGCACLWSELVTSELVTPRLWSRLPVAAALYWQPEPPQPRNAAPLVNAANRMLAEAGILDMEADVRTLLERFGVPRAFHDLVTLLEPVKWYARLLGPEALAARLRGTEIPQARPYDANTPLARVADALVPESCSAVALSSAFDADDVATLRTLVERWRADFPDWEQDAAVAQFPDEMRPAVRRVLIWVRLVGGELTGASSGQMPPVGDAIGEYVVAFDHAAARWLEARNRG